MASLASGEENAREEEGQKGQTCAIALFDRRWTESTDES